ncbi:MAG: putative PurR-regulated permease PerM [Glaciecola sp.]|jgi:predicted PurR-regulated permease PerM
MLAKNQFALNSLFFIVILYTLHFAKSLLVPLVFTALIALMLSPIVNLLKRLKVPRVVSAVILLSLFLMPFAVLTVNLAEPVQKWAKLIPELTTKLTLQIESVTEEFERSQQELKPKTEEESGFFSWFTSDDEEPEPSPKNPNAVTEKLKESGINAITSVFVATPALLAQVVTVIILILFLLIFSPALYSSFLSGLNTDGNKEKAVRIITSIQKQLSRYVLTMSFINLGLGICTAIGLHLVGLEDAILWGAIAGLMNFIPYVGMVLSTTIIALASSVQFGFNISILAPISIYLGINVLESQFITPLVMGRNMRINPLIVIVWLLIWGWLWGVVGLLLAVPMLVSFKIALRELGIWQHCLSVIESGSVR